MTNTCKQCGEKLEHTFEEFYAEYMINPNWHEEEKCYVELPFCNNHNCMRHGLISLSKEQLTK